MIWPQNYTPAGSVWLSALVAALPVAVLLGSIALLRLRIHLAALLGLAVSLAIGYLTKYSGIDATMGLALAQTGTLYPFFGTLLG